MESIRATGGKERAESDCEIVMNGFAVHDQGHQMESSAHAGRDQADAGPKISKLAKDRLSTSRYSALGRIACSYRDGVLMLRGCVPSHYLKQLAQELVCQIEGVHSVVNQIEVKAAMDRDQV
jgi:osmotically-inducible protein OsmY